MSDATDSSVRKRMQSLNSFKLLCLFNYLSFPHLLLSAFFSYQFVFHFHIIKLNMNQ